MELGIFAKTFRRSSVRAVMEAVRSLELGCVQFNFECAGLPSMPEEVPPSVFEAVAAASREAGVRLAAISGTFNMAHPEPEVRREGARRLEVVGEAARRFQAPLVTLCTGTRDRENMWRAHPDNRSRQAWADLLNTMEGVLPLAARAGIAFAIEPEHANVIENAISARALLDELQAGDRLKVILDPANLLESDRPQPDVLREALDLLGDNLAIAHAKDRQPNDRTCALGQGIVDFEAYFDLLHSVDFNGPIIMHGFEEAEAAESTAFVAAKLREVQGNAFR
jgi:sugar phosphate isomerase/epimerase